MNREVTTEDGRKLVYEAWGDPKGHPVFLLHGTPGSRHGPRPRTMVLYQLGIYLIAYDRPGYGGSTRASGRQVVHAADDVRTIAESLGLKSFSVVGRSGGGPHALACAARYPGLVRSAAVLVSLAPHDAEGLDWFDGMTESNVREYTKAQQNRDELSKSLGENAGAISGDPLSLLSDLVEEMPVADRTVVADAGIRTMLRRNFATGLATDEDCPGGWVDDAVSFCQKWGFDPADIRVPTLLWHGELDVFSPLGHFRWLAERIEGATVVLQPGVAHFAAVSALPEVLVWLRTHPASPDAARTMAHGVPPT
ncbi:alpha/beta hydrolase [Streptomyces sp. SPB162]|uniref:alpha/beta fold hydrolase n=1 Tax=Streptomyces sp. SPB162 TaxID=2940560 RepID=UPI0024072041|nr:alpha/beta hydrolase [Streptomyces sp. SPB162]MDF9810793.1 pimeloyl-ACP methyl ester carboxylesterase [Streptomyces sp. SPB162]